MKNLDAVIFDFDGVLVDSEPFHQVALNAVLAPLGLELSQEEYEEHYLGFDDRGVFQHRFHVAHRPLEQAELRRLVDDKAIAFAKLIEARSIQPFPGAVDLLAALKAEKVPLALCTGATHRDVRAILHKVRALDQFDAIVTTDEVATSKPDPTCYRLALEKLWLVHPQSNIRPQHALAIEDSPWGIEAAKGAGLKVAGLESTYTAPRLRKADFTLPTLAGVTPAALDALLTQTLARL
jgi:beta-phosphoglucomutase